MKQELTSISEYRKMVGAKISPFKARMSASEYNSTFGKEKVAVKRDYSGKEKVYIERVLGELGIDFVKEYQFASPRKWRFDWCMPIRKVAIEYEGLMSKKSGHTTVTGYTRNTEKYNAATGLGWRVYRYTALNYRDVEADLRREFGL